MDKYSYEFLLPSEYFYMRDEIIKNNPEFQLLISDSLVMKNKDKYNEYKECNLKQVKVNDKVSYVSESLLHDVLFNDGMFKYLVSSLDVDSEIAISLLLFEDEQIIDNIKITKAELVNAIKELDIYNLPSIIQTRIALIIAMTNTKVCFNKYTDETYKCIIDNEEVEIHSVDLVRLLTCSEREFNSFITNNTNSKLSKHVVAYMLIDFVIKEGIFDKYVFDEMTYQRFNNLKSYRSLDFESVNKLNKSDDVDLNGKSLLREFSINPELRECVMEGLKPTYSKLESSIYIYLKLCDILTYDEDVFASQSKNEKIGSHQNLSDIYFITPTNNKIVSHEFMLIYAKFLKEIGIKYSLSLDSIGGFSNSKSTIRFKDGEYLVFIDLFEDVIKNDVSMIKIGGSLNCIRSYNTNEITKAKFNETLYKVYSDYNKTKERKQEFNDLINEYNNEYKTNTNINFRSRLAILLKLISRKNLKGIDNINYIKEVYNKIFGESDEVSLEVLIKKQSYHSRPVILVTKDKYIFLVDANDYEPIKLISREQLDDMFGKNIITKYDRKNIDEEMNHVGSIKK